MLKASRKIGLVFFPAFDWAISPTHPEREERLLYTQDQVMEEGLLDVDGIIEYRVRPATTADIQRVHFCVPDEEAVTTESHLISAGGCLVAADAVLRGEVESAFALVRPPGHHAMRVVHGNRGFCNINIEAIMIEYLRDRYGIRKVAIVDTDCHHGDGTQDIYWHDPDTLFISIHQDGRTLYPGSGFPHEAGGPNAQGATVNIPLPPKTGEEGFLYTLEELVMPLLERFEPELVINSAGQDNHFNDPITNMNFSARGYAQLNARLRPDLAVLEGGYAVEDALPYVNLGIIMAMAGLDTSCVKEPNYDRDYRPQPPDITMHIHRVVDEIKTLFLEGGLNKTAFTEGEIVERNRNIFYDTDMIYEKQRERIRACSHCAGALSIDSSATTGRHILGVHIPRDACDLCQATGRKWFEEAASGGSFNQVYLQDRVRRVYEKI
ncbi:histone deacetylase family protein [Desulfatiglans anilini]|uniref:histone deacetylase family protein n=1 Tax=Desulfatiglans anilini TaxID=90728 RepID=UPI000401A3AD|nr:histone deacetylase [Desulfatiglans anilini]